MKKKKLTSLVVILSFLLSFLPIRSSLVVKAEPSNPLKIEKIIGLSSIPGTFRKPYGVAIAKDGTIFIADTGESQIEVFDSKLNYLRSFGSIGSGDGQFQEIQQITFDQDENLYVLDRFLCNIQVFTKEGKLIRKIGGRDEEYNPLSSPNDFAFLKTSELLVIETNDPIKVFSPEGKFLREFVQDKKYQSNDWYPDTVTVDKYGSVYISMFNWSSSNYNFVKFNPDGSLIGEFVKVGTEEKDIINDFKWMTTEDNNFYLSDGFSIKKYEILPDPKKPLQFLEIFINDTKEIPGQSAIQEISAIKCFNKNLYLLDYYLNLLVILSDTKKVVGTIQSSIYEYGDMFPDKESIKNIFSKPRGITIGPDNHFYIANGYFNKVSIFDSDWEEIGSIGKPIEKQKKALGELGSPVDISFDKQGNIFVSDSEKDHQSIEVYTKDQTPYQSISSVNGSPSGLAFNSAGNLIVVKDTVGLEVYDTTQLAEKKITKIKTYRNDGFGLLDLAVDENDNMIVSIFYSSEIQWISPKGRMLQKIAGQFGNLDTLSYPRGLFQDGAGNIYVCEPVAGRIQKFSPEGDMIWKSELNWSGLSYITMDSQGKLYVTDVDHNVALVITDKTAIPPGKNDLPPKLTIKPIPNEVFDPNLLIEGETDPGATVAIDRKEIEVEEDGSFSTTLKLIKGNNTINIVATNKAKKQTSQTITVTLKDIPDTTPPSLKLKIIPSVVYESPLLIEGETEPNAIVTVNAKEVSVKQDGSFSTEIDLVKGSNTIKVRATDKAGNQSNLEISITYIERIVIKLIVGSTIIIVKGVPGILDSVPFIDKLSGRTMVPLRAIAEAIGATVSYNAKEQRIDILKDSVLIQLWIGKPKALVNGKEVSIDIQKPISPMIVKGRTFLPLRFIAETFEFQVDWDPKTQGITLTYPKR